MSNRFYLIQRGKFRNNLDSATALVGSSDSHLINPDYMGSAEFEWGAIPKAYRRIMGQYDQYSLHVTDLVTTRGVPFCVFCKNDHYDKILEAIKLYLKEDYRLKELTNMHVHFTEPKSDWDKEHCKWKLQTNFWWCIDIVKPNADINNPYESVVGDWIAFIGATDRQRCFTQVIGNDHSLWWLRKTDDERKKEYDDAFRRF